MKTNGDPLPVYFCARTCTCGHVVTATSAIAAMDAMDEHYIAMQHIGLTSAFSGVSAYRFGRQWDRR